MIRAPSVLCAVGTPCVPDTVRTVRRHITRLAVAVLLAVVLPPSGSAHAQDAPAADLVARSLFEPELIMKHRRAIGLTDEQRDAISELIRRLQGDVVSLQWEVQEQAESLAAELNRPRIDIDRALDRFGKVVQTERKLKEAQLVLLMRIKNVLRPEQQETLRRLRAPEGGAAG